MKKLIFTFLFGLQFYVQAQDIQFAPDTIDILAPDEFKIAFGSCFDQDKSSKIFLNVVNQHPNLWVWLGDNIYGDTENMDTMESKYNKVLSDRFYSLLKDTLKTPIIGTWDDHDFGVNDGGTEFPKKDESEALALDFLNVPQNSARRKHNGLYGAYYIRVNKGKLDEYSTLFIILDLRYFKEDKNKTKASLLGNEQWEWLQQILTTDKSQFTFICSSLQVIPNEHKWERWDEYPKERLKLFKLLEKRQGHCLILSGDRHRAEYSKYESKKLSIYEVTSSSLNIPGNCSEETNSQRVGKVVCDQTNFGVLRIKFSSRTKVKNPLTVELQGHKGKISELVVD